MKKLFEICLKAELLETTVKNGDNKTEETEFRIVTAENEKDALAISWATYLEEVLYSKELDCIDILDLNTVLVTCTRKVYLFNGDETKRDMMRTDKLKVSVSVSSTPNKTLGKINSLLSAPVN